MPSWLSASASVADRCSPTEVQLTSSSACRGVLTASAPSSRASSMARSGVLFHTETLAAPALRRPHTAARALPPAPSTSALMPPTERSSAAMRPGASVFSASMLPSAPKVSVLAAPIARAASLARSASASAERLWGIVTFAPTKPLAGSARTVSSKSSGGERQSLIAPIAHPARREGGLEHRGRAAVGHRPTDHAEPRHHFFLQEGTRPPFLRRASR